MILDSRKGEAKKANQNNNGKADDFSPRGDSALLTQISSLRKNSSFPSCLSLRVRSSEKGERARYWDEKWRHGWSRTLSAIVMQMASVRRPRVSKAWRSDSGRLGSAEFIGSLV